MITHGNKQISEIVYARKASEGGGAVRLTNIIRGAQVVFGGIASNVKWLNGATKAAILAAFGQKDGNAVLGATNAYLKALAETNPTKATALAVLINEDPMLVCSIGLQPQGVTMPERTLNGDGYAYIDTGYKAVADTSMDIQFMWPNSISIRYCSLILCDTGGLEYGITHWNSFYWHYGGYQSFSGIAANVKFIIETRKNVLTLYRDGNIVTTSTRPERTGSTTTNGTLPLYAWRRSGSVMKEYITNAKVWYLRLYENMIPVREMYPFIRNGENGMLDILSGTFYPNANTSGSFTIAYTLPDGTPWTPLNQTT